MYTRLGGNGDYTGQATPHERQQEHGNQERCPNHDKPENIQTQHCHAGDLGHEQALHFLVPTEQQCQQPSQRRRCVEQEEQSVG
ncbi:MAG: hypothetical protein DRI77_07075 [Chloroflexi bacterium]|nr:MAG: hypothetical protein DRI77_07075 [Chloroflexota bacterium]